MKVNFNRLIVKKIQDLKFKIQNYWGVHFKLSQIDIIFAK